LYIEKDDDAAIYQRAIREGGRAEMHSLLAQFTLAVLNSAPLATAASITSRLQAAYSPWKPKPEDDRFAVTTPEVFRSSLGGRQVVTVSWLVRLGDRGVPESTFIMQDYVEMGGQFHLAGEAAGSLFENHSEFVTPVPSQLIGELWFVVHGTSWGSSRGSMAVALYAFDGTRVTTRWSRPDLSNGEIKILPTGIELDYYEYPVAGQGGGFVVEQLDFAPSGLVTRSRVVK
jgi:hypothetical protein